jgi:DNA modification methylase
MTMEYIGRQRHPLKVEYFATSELLLRSNNARTHSRKQVRQIAASIIEFGFTNPVLVDDSNRILAGHGRVEAAKSIGLTSIPVVRLSDLSESQKRAYVLADNKLAENAGWNHELLATELGDLLNIDLDFDVEITGFETAEIDLLVEGLDQGSSAETADHVPTMASRSAVTRVGDLWRLGEHRVLCGDARDSDIAARLMAEDKARMLITDPPYNVPIDGFVSGKGRVKHREFACASGEMSEKEFRQFLQVPLSCAMRHSMDGALHYVFIDWRHLEVMLSVGSSVYDALKAICVWNKTNAGMGSLYRSKHELVCVFKTGTAPHINNVELGRYGRHRTNVWDYPGVNVPGPDRAEQLAWHPTVKPAALVADAILDASRRGDIVLDLFAGSGTTAIAAERTGRRARLLEIDPLYVDTTVRRWQDYTGDTAVLGADGRAFGEVAERRRSAIRPEEFDEATGNKAVPTSTGLRRPADEQEKQKQ